ncbi:tyrosine-type recombinase/integrase [Ferruginibacter sp.]|nr:tyrosine-type recombinase/integrase [Ferruginibacter sp.]
MVTLEQICKRSYYRERHIHTPLLQERLQYLQYWVDRNTSLHTLKSIAQYLLRIVEYLHLENSGTITLPQIEKAAIRWAKYQYNHPQKKASFSKTGKKRFIWYAVDWLKRLNRLEPLPEERVPLFTKIFERRKALRRHTSAPLLKERIMYLQYWADNGAVENSLRRIAQYLLIVMDYLKFFKLRMVSVNDIEQAAKKWATRQSILRPENNYSKFAKARFVCDASHWFEMLGCLNKESKPPLPFAEQFSKYVDYMRLEQGLSENTIGGRFFQLKDFLISINQKRKTLATITPLTVDEVLAKKHNIDGYSRRSVQSYASVVRSFLRYMENQGWCSEGLANSIKAPRVYSYESLPSSPYWDDIKKVVANSRTNYPTDIRDYAILLLLSVYGMRSSEVVNLCLDDLDWKNERLYLRRAKRSKPQIYPLTPIVGEAILRYLKEVRPNNYLLKEVFISRRSPYRSLKTSAIYQIVSRRLKPLKLKIKHHGPHALRHGCATHLINEGISLKEISDHLGHQNLETTRIYTKVDLTSLRKVTELNLEGLL